MITIFLLSVAGAIIAAVIGTFWYSDKTPMGKIHMRYLGFDLLSPEEQRLKIQQAKPMMPKMYALQLLLSVIKAFFVVFVITLSVKNGVSFGAAILFPIFAWLCYDVTTIGSALLWSNCDPKIVWKKFFSDIFANLVTIIAIAILTGLFL
jgi:hypothetical protein